MMSTPAEKVKYLNETKVAIKDAIVAKGVEVAEDATFRSYAASIAAIDTKLPEQEKTLEVTENGEYEVSPDEGYVISKVTATVNVPTGGGGGAEVEPIVLTGACNYACSGSLASKYIELFGDTISTSGITNASYMFNNYKNETVPFDINLSNTSTSVNLGNMFYSSRLTSPPLIKGDIKAPTSAYSGTVAMNSMFASCQWLREIPYDYFHNFGGEEFWEASKKYNTSRNGIFDNCRSLRQAPDLKMLPTATTSAYSNLYYNLFNNCYVLDEVLNLPVLDMIAITSNYFSSTANWCYRLKDFTFETNEDGSPKIAQWKGQTISLTAVGYMERNYSDMYITKYNSGITEDKEVDNDEKYQALKNDPDWYAISIDYSRYNHDSAVATINSLPDTSAYLATAGGTNTIQFKGAAGSATDGGAINTLTEEEIAVATAKGWTVTLS